MGDLTLELTTRGGYPDLLHVRMEVYLPQRTAHFTSGPLVFESGTIRFEVCDCSCQSVSSELLVSGENLFTRTYFYADRMNRH